MNKILLCTDMDRTVIPNGLQPESSNARQRFKELCALPSLQLVYVTGRHLQLMQQAISDYDLPAADYAITDVGTRIYYREDSNWCLLPSWQEEIDQDWAHIQPKEVFDRLASIVGMTAQESAKQNKHKISFYIDLRVCNEKDCLAQVAQRLADLNMRSNLIWSIDEFTGTGLLDILPATANKLHAIRFLQQQLGYADRELVFAGDSGNDLEVLSSSVQAVLVANASDAVKSQAQALAARQQNGNRLYLATNQNDACGNYSAGVLQGVLHYMPALKKQLENHFLSKG
ncbi:HAD-IIB family hydrolase [Thiomicrorhabdus sediminis]|uniref:HAD-IIB family hydrolase n=1 Tax=Thiomicrorhabdus sediminis TaxID=2580412 RepID=A0A4P9K660_9GAMM|nr:HAD-IIB family hydrolase [Thiomicrorhabdus sediminis]QCU89950.1 HAD-IIB family hydrolase [Thiomicrorhabdus sediminis]